MTLPVVFGIITAICTIASVSTGTFVAIRAANRQAASDREEAFIRERQVWRDEASVSTERHDQLQAAYRELLDEFRAERRDLQASVADLKAENGLLTREVKDLRKENRDLHLAVVELTAKISRLEGQSDSDGE